MVRGPAFVPVLLIASCSVDLGVEEMRYHCDSDSQCAAGFLCDPIFSICSESSDAGSKDAMVTPCGFDEEFTLLDPPGWQRNGSTSPLVDFVQLTPAEPNERGTLWYRPRVRAERFTFEMVFNIFGGGAEGGDGMTIAWIMEDASASGGATANLGAYGLTGYVVEIDTLPNVGIGDPATEHIAFARTRGELLPEIDPLGVASALPPLRSREERVLRVEFDLGVAQIFLDGALVLTATATDYSPFDATFGATAATGSRTDSHTVRRLSLFCR